MTEAEVKAKSAGVEAAAKFAREIYDRDHFDTCAIALQIEEEMRALKKPEREDTGK